MVSSSCKLTMLLPLFGRNIRSTSFNWEPKSQLDSNSRRFFSTAVMPCCSVVPHWKACHLCFALAAAPLWLPMLGAWNGRSLATMSHMEVMTVSWRSKKTLDLIWLNLGAEVVGFSIFFGFRVTRMFLFTWMSPKACRKIIPMPCPSTTSAAFLPLASDGSSIGWTGCCHRLGMWSTTRLTTTTSLRIAPTSAEKKTCFWFTTQHVKSKTKMFFFWQLVDTEHDWCAISTNRWFIVVF